MTTPIVAPRDPRTQIWTQAARPDLEGRLGSLYALSNGRLGLRGSHEEMPAWGRPEFYVSGTYSGGPPSLLGFHDPDHILSHPDRMTERFRKSLSDTSVATLPNFPNPAAIRLSVGGEEFSFERSKVLSCERLLEIDQALLRRRLVFRDGQGRKTRVDSRRFVSFAEPHLICLRYAVETIDHAAEVRIQPYIKQDVTNANGVVLWSILDQLDDGLLKAIECVTNQSRIKVSIAQLGELRNVKGRVVLDLFIAAGPMDMRKAVDLARLAQQDGFDKCFRRHLAAFEAQRQGAAVEFDADADTVQGFNFSQMHMHMAFCYDNNKVGIPIKGLTGHGYRFLNFWDMDFHMFPYYLLTKPRQARLLLEYRYNQLDAYRANARAWGAAGAQVPWETQLDGSEQTAPWLCLQDREIHISADAAYMFKLYDELTPDSDALIDMGAEFVMETARFYASRVRFNAARRRYELPGVGCPDQYHTFADNNVFISMMARWNLQYALKLADDPRHSHAVRKINLAPAELARWKEIVDNFYVIGPNADGIIEEFDGFFELSDDLDGICETFCRHSQAVKQPDVLAAFIPFEDSFPPAVRRRNWLFYAARTMHGSSLSLPGMAYAAARCGLNDQALYYLHKSARMDVDDVNLDSDRGVHVSAGAVQWQAAVLGFGGLTPKRKYLHLRPNLPRQWRRLRFAVHWQFQRVRFEITHRRVVVEADAANDAPAAVKIGRRAVMELAPGRRRIVKL